MHDVCKMNAGIVDLAELIELGQRGFDRLSHLLLITFHRRLPSSPPPGR